MTAMFAARLLLAATAVGAAAPAARSSRAAILDEILDDVNYANRDVACFVDAPRSLPRCRDVSRRGEPK